jgi:hypothetical protein
MAYKTATIEVTMEVKVFMDECGEIRGWEPARSYKWLDAHVREMADGADFEEEGE